MMMLVDIAAYTKGGADINSLLNMNLDEIFYIAEKLNKRALTDG